MDLDQKICSLPVVGKIVQRFYSYFRKNIAFADAIHVALGLGIAFLIVGGKWLWLGIGFIVMGLLGHLWAYIKG